MILEIWRDIKGSEDRYQVSSLGRVRSYCSKGKFLHKEPHILKQGTQNSGYKHITLIKDGKKITRTVHQLVAETFIGKEQEKMVCHLNDIKHDNRVDNLYYGTSKSNAEDARKNGKLAVGIKINTNKKTEQEILQLRKEYSEGIGVMALSRKYGLAHSTVGSIVKNRIWRHI